MRTINIAGRQVGEGAPCFIIAEAGVNHNGDIRLAKKLIDAAVEAKVDAVKFQTFIAEEEVTQKTPKADYQSKNSEADESYQDMIKKLELDETDHRILRDYCREKGIIFLSTPSEEKSAEMLNRLGVEAFKIGSNDIVTLPMLIKIAGYGKPMIMSRGMATKQEIEEAICAVRSEGNNDIIILHCTSNYPSKACDLNLSAINQLKKEFDVLVGYSDHSEGLDAPVIAALLGAVVIEKHITLDRTLPGPDQSFSIDPAELKQMVEEIRAVECLSEEERQKKLDSIENLKEILGNPDIQPIASEIEMRKCTRKSIVAKSDIKAGDILSLDNIAFKRPAFGIPANKYQDVLGKKTLTNIDKDELIQLENLE
ncbi:N-acetylneuraminate synthase family protein [Candidatus Woesearchaeota archaeon]|nr:N-acetylneuraminate synthase family protein [Candidatus Woesearchaeota archaeon]